MARRDWHLLGCQVEVGGDVLIDTVSTSGVASASYYWSLVPASVGRFTRLYCRTISYDVASTRFSSCAQQPKFHCLGVRTSGSDVLGQVLSCLDVRTKGAVDHQLDWRSQILPRAPIPRTTLPMYVTPSPQLGEVGTGLREDLLISPCSTD